MDLDTVECMLDRLALTNSPGSLRLVYDACQNLFAYGRAQGWCSGDFAMPVPAKNPQPPITIYTPDEVAVLIAAARGKGLRWWAFLATVAHTGRRVGEVLRLEWSWLRLDADVPHFNLPTTKNKRQAYVPLGPTLMRDVFTPENIEKLQAPGGGREWEFRRDPAVHPFPWSYSSVVKMLDRHCERVGIECRGFHRFRHTKATELLGKGVPIQAVSALLGHASVATTDRIYNHATALNYAAYLD
jgi:integrase